MKKFFKLLLITCFSSLTLWGCNQSASTPLVRVVTGVDISCQHEDVQIRRHYTDTEKMEYVLIYLRLLKPVGLPETNPEAVDADVYQITLQLSDGNQKIYRQKDHRYLCANAGPWRSIPPEQAEGLYRLMRKLPSDRV